MHESKINAIMNADILTPEQQAHSWIIGTPRIPKSQIRIPEWIDPGEVPSEAAWSVVDEHRLAEAVMGMSPTGRELIQKLCFRRKKPFPMGQGVPLNLSKGILQKNEFAVIERILAGDNNLGAFIGENLWRVDYRRRPPTMEEFLVHPEYLGTMMHPDNPGGIWPAWFRILCDEFDRDSLLHNVVLTGALGTGKTTVMVVILLYRICLLLLLKRPAEMFGQGTGTPLYFVIISVTREAAQQTAFTQARNLMAASSFFRQMAGIGLAGVSSCRDIELARANQNETQTLVHLTSGSRPQHMIGRSIIGVGFDEGNYRLEKNQDTSAFEIYEAMRNRLISRLKTRGGHLSGITIIASSARDESSLTEQIRLEIDAADTPREQRVIQKAIFEVKPIPAESLKQFFKVTYGQANQEPVLLPGIFDSTGNQISEFPSATCVPTAPGKKTVCVPTIYQEAFQRNCRQALQDICGISCGGSGRLFPTMIDVDQCLELSKQAKVPRTWKQDELSISSEDKNNIWDFLDHASFLIKQGGRVVPLRHPDRMRYVHIDLATQTFAGIAICHLCDPQTISGLVRDGEAFSESRVIVEYDFILAITPGKTKPINFEKIQKFFLWLKTQCGFKFGLVTADQYQSDMPLQMLEAKGFAVGRLSIDRDKTAYRQWRAAFEERRIRLALNNRMYYEASQLMEYDKKYDHPPKGTKDVTDAAAGAYLNAVNSNEVKNPAGVNDSGMHWKSPDTSGADQGKPPIAIPLEPYASTRKPQIFRV